MEDEEAQPDDLPDWNPVPPGVDQALWAEFQLVSSRVHELEHGGDDGAAPSPVRRVMIELPEEWVLLFAWIARRDGLRAKGLNGPTQYTPEMMETLGLGRIASGMVRNHIRHLVREHYYEQLHTLCTGQHFLWSNKDMAAAAAAKAKWEASMAKFNASDDSDDLPF